MSSLDLNNSHAAKPLRIEVLGVLLLIFAGGLFHAWLYRAFQPDDTFIFLVYVKNFLAGHGLTFNGERVEGFSSLLWTLLVALAGWVGNDLLLSAKTLAFLIYLAGGALMIRSANWISDTEGGWRTACLAAMYFGLPPLALWASGAMETVLAAVLLLFAFASFFRAACVTGSKRDYAAAGILFGAVSLTRPEGVAFIGAVPFFLVVRWLLGNKLGLRGAILTIAMFLAIVALLLTWRYVTYGQWLPLTVAAKTGDLNSQMVRGGIYLRSFAHEYWWAVAVFIISTVVLLAQRGRHAWWAFLALTVVVGNTLFVYLVGGDWMIGFRYMVPVLPIALVTVYLAASQSTFALLTATAFLVGSGVYTTKVKLPEAQLQALHSSGDILMGQYIRDLRLPAFTKIAVLDAGAIPYITGLPTIDMGGLNNAHIAKRAGGFMSKFDNQYILEQKPYFIQMPAYEEKGHVVAGEFLGTALMFYTEEFQRFYELDRKSPISQLFRRREVPLQGTFLASFTDATWSHHFSPGTRKLTVDVTKTGDGIWGASPDGVMRYGRAFFRIRVSNQEGVALSEHHEPLRESQVRGESSRATFNAPSVPKGLRTEVCITLFQVRDITCTPVSID